MSAPTPSVSVVVPNYNHAAYLRRRIDTVLGQTYTDIEVLLLDDASTDDSRRVIEEYAADPRVSVHLNRRNSGSTFKQWNRGVREARGEYVWFAESDDLAEPTLLERVVGMLERNPQCGVGCCESWLLHGTGEPSPDNLEAHYRPEPRREFWTRDFVADGPEICVRDLLHGNPMPNASAVVFRRALFERVGGADEGMKQAGDRMLWAKMLSMSALAHVGERLNYFRFHDVTVRSRTQSRGRTIAEVYAVLRYLRHHVPMEAQAFERGLDTNAAYFARASAERGVGLLEMMDACRRVRDVDPRIWTRLALPWLGHRARRLARVARGAGGRVARRIRAAAGVSERRDPC